MPFSKSRFVPVAFWVGFLALGLATNVNHEQKTRGVAHSRQEMSVASASAKRLPLLIQDRTQIVRD
ncbi:hypothetical protein C5688_03565 [Methylocystis sp. MitZ-2018]|nr:hypothetical protein C5688_03565 [Methylocystis sp. MitZ-2018]